ncbi:hypothetical protein [Sphaerothrix gracilis]
MIERPGLSQQILAAKGFAHLANSLFLNGGIAIDVINHTFFRSTSAPIAN